MVIQAYTIFLLIQLVQTKKQIQTQKSLFHKNLSTESVTAQKESNQYKSLIYTLQKKLKLLQKNEKKALTILSTA